MVIGVAATNCYFLYREDSKKCVVIDAPDKGKEIAAALSKHGFEIEALLLTHGHFDHIWGASELRQVTGAKIYALDAEQPLLEDSRLNVSAQSGRPCTVKVNKYFKDGDVLDLAGMKIKVIATPGHTAGSCCFYVEEAGILVAGDTLFYESVGRCDLPTGSGMTLERTLRKRFSPFRPRRFAIPDTEMKQAFHTR